LGTGKLLSGYSVGVVFGVIAVVATTSGLGVFWWQSVRTTSGAGFWYENGTFSLPTHATTTLGGPLTEQEIESIKLISISELQRAFEGFRITVTQNRDAFWRVVVLQTLRGRGPLPSAGRSLPLGPLGGIGEVNFVLVALKAVQYAPPESSRRTMIEGIGRGIGRVAAHEFAHQILGSAAVHNDADANSYEYPSPDRASQYYGELRWTTALPLLQRKLGK
jgi:hypothetical protein